MSELTREKMRLPFGDGQRAVDHGYATPAALALLVALATAAAVAALRALRAAANAASQQQRAPAKCVPLFADVEAAATSHGGASNRLLPAALRDAAADGDVSRILGWLASDGASADASSKGGTTLLHAASAAGHVGTIRVLLEAGADVLAADSEMRTALHFVAVEGHGTCVKPLLDAGGDPEYADSQGRTPLSLAEDGRHIGCLKLMRLHLERRKAATAGARDAAASAYRRPV